jgi:hypothetical protein
MSPVNVSPSRVFTMTPFVAVTTSSTRFPVRILSLFLTWEYRMRCRSCLFKKIMGYPWLRERQHLVASREADMPDPYRAIRCSMLPTDSCQGTPDGFRSRMTSVGRLEAFTMSS